MQKKCGYIIGKLEEFRNVPRKFWREIHKHLLVGNVESNVVNIQVETPNGEKVEGYQAACETNSQKSERL